MLSSRDEEIISMAERLPASLRVAVNDSVEPCDDFYAFACGAWISNTSRIDSDQEATPKEMCWDEARDTVDSDLLRLIRVESAPTSEGPFRALRDWYASCTNETAAEEAGALPLSPFLDAIDGIATLEDLHEVPKEPPRARRPDERTALVRTLF